ELKARIVSPRLREVGRRLGRQLLRTGRAVAPSPSLANRALDGCQQPVVLGAVAAAVGCTPHEAALIALHHLSAAITGAATKLLGLDPLAVVAVQARATAFIDHLAGDAARWATCPPADLPSLGGTLTEILGEHHGHWTDALFVA